MIFEKNWSDGLGRIPTVTSLKFSLYLKSYKEPATDPIDL